MKFTFGAKIGSYVTRLVNNLIARWSGAISGGKLVDSANTGDVRTIEQGKAFYGASNYTALGGHSGELALSTDFVYATVHLAAYDSSTKVLFSVTGSTGNRFELRRTASGFLPMGNNNYNSVVTDESYEAYLEVIINTDNAYYREIQGFYNANPSKVDVTDGTWTIIELAVTSSTLIDPNVVDIFDIDGSLAKVGTLAVLDSSMNLKAMWSASCVAGSVVKDLVGDVDLDITGDLATFIVDDNHFHNYNNENGYTDDPSYAPARLHGGKIVPYIHADEPFENSSTESTTYFENFTPYKGGFSATHNMEYGRGYAGIKFDRNPNIGEVVTLSFDYVSEESGSTKLVRTATSLEGGALQQIEQIPSGTGHYEHTFTVSVTTTGNMYILFWGGVDTPGTYFEITNFKMTIFTVDPEPNKLSGTPTGLDTAGNVLTYKGNVPLPMEVYGRNVLTLNGTSQFIDVPNIPEDQPLVITTTFKLNSIGANQVIHSYGTDNARIYINAAGFVVVGYVVSTAQLSQGTIHTTKLFINDMTRITSCELDGVVIYDQFVNSTIANDKVFLIGARDSGTVGLFSDATFYSFEISGYVKLPLLEGGQSDTIYDVSGNGNHGTLEGFDLSTAWGWSDEEVSPNYLNGFSHKEQLIFASTFEGCYIQSTYKPYYQGKNLTNSYIDTSKCVITSVVINGNVWELDFSSTGTTESNFQFKTGPLLNVVAGETYRFSIDMKTSKPASARFSMGRNGTPYTAVSSYIDYTTSTEWVRHVVDLTVTLDDDMAVFRSFLGDQGAIKYYFRNLRAVKLNGGESATYGTESINLLPDQTLSGEAYLPAINGTQDMLEEPLTNPAGDWHNDAEVMWKAPLSPSLFLADLPVKYLYGNVIDFATATFGTDGRGTVSKTDPYTLVYTGTQSGTLGAVIGASLPADASGKYFRVSFYAKAASKVGKVITGLSNPSVNPGESQTISNPPLLADVYQKYEFRDIYWETGSLRMYFQFGDGDDTGEIIYYKNIEVKYEEGYSYPNYQASNVLMFDDAEEVVGEVIESKVTETTWSNIKVKK